MSNINIGADYSKDFLNNLYSNSKSNGLDSLSNSFGDYNSIKNGSYKKLASAYYNQQSKLNNVVVKPAEKNETSKNYKQVQAASTQLVGSTKELSRNGLYEPEFKEIKDEYKNTEGDPNVKAALRQRRMQMLHRGMMDSVAEADFVVRNPLHVACALKYDQESMDSPMLTAKGSELIAKQIIELAEQNQVPVIDNAPVARALYRMVEVNQLIPPELYKAVAEILLFVYNLKKQRH